MRNDSSQNYKTPYSNISNFREFTDNVRKEKDELEKLDRKLRKQDREITNPHPDGMNFNTITHKMDKNITKKDLEDRIKALEDDGVEDTDHKYKLEKEQDKAKMESYHEFVQKKMMGDTEYSDDTHVTSYMFFGNLQTIHRLSEEILQMDQSKVNQMLDDGHNWAEDHITTAKVQITQVYNFLMNKTLKENHQHNYMFFANLERILEQTSKLLQLDEKMVDETLVNGHDWAEDHISSAKENIEQVHDFLQNEMM